MRACVRPGVTFLAVVLLSLSGFPLFAGVTEGPASPAAWQSRGEEAMIAEDWYGAVEAFLEALRLNPSYAQSMASLSDCYYSIGEFDQALTTVQKARKLSRSNANLENLEACILIALGRIDEADKLVSDVLSREPYNREARFTSAELSLARGRTGEAAEKYRETVRRYPDDRRALLSLALVLGSLGDSKSARIWAEKAVEAHPDDARCHYYSAYLDSQVGRLGEAAASLEKAIALKEGFTAARSLLAQVRFRQGNWEEAAGLCDLLIRDRREDSLAWYVKGLSFSRLGKAMEARTILSQALNIDPSDEFIRAALEDLLIHGTPVESSDRERASLWHFARAKSFQSRHYTDQALFEYRRGLRLYPYSKERAAYADILRSLGYPARQLSELRFLEDQGKADRAINDAVETYDSLLADALHRRWGVDPDSLSGRHWKIAVMTLKSEESVRHVDASDVAASFFRDLCAHSGTISLVNVPVEQGSFSAAFRSARESGSDYFLVLQAKEGDRDLTLSGGLYVSRTGSAAASFKTFRTGEDRLRNTSRQILDELAKILPFRAELLSRRGGLALLDAGKGSGVKKGQIFDIVRNGALETKGEGVGLLYSEGDVLGSIAVDEVDEEVSQGTLSRSGFFDRIASGDHLIPHGEKKTSPAKVSSGALAADAQLQAMLRGIR